MGRDFTSASSQRIDTTNTTLANWEYSQTMTIAYWFYPKSNGSGTIVGKFSVAGNSPGWNTITTGGTSAPKIQMALRNAAAHQIVVNTNAEFALNTWHSVVITYDGLSLAAGVKVYVDSGTPQAQTATSDNLSTNSILNSVATQIGARGGASAPTTFLNATLRRVLLYNVVLGSSDIATLIAGAGVPFKSDSTKLQLWQEFGPLNDGATFVADWSGNGNAGFVAGAGSSAPYSTNDPTITAVTPYLGTSGGRTLSGPITKVTYNPPFMACLGWVNGANSGLSGQIGPGYILKTGTGAYSAWLENAHNVQTLDPPNQGGSNNDTPSIYGSSTDGLTFTLTSQDNSAGSMFNVNNIGLNLTAPQLAAFKVLAKAETSIATVLWDPDDQIWKCWFHGGNNTGNRQIFYATNAGDPATANWQLQATGLPVVSIGAGGTWEESDVYGPKVIRVSSNRMVMLYSAFDAGKVHSQIGQAESTDRGLTWTKNGSNPVIANGAAGTFDDHWLGTASLNFDAPTGLFVSWIGTASTLVTANRPTSIEFAYSADGKVWTKGVFGPIANGRDVASSNSATEFIFGASSVDVFQDGTTYKLWYRGDDGVSGAPGFRGRNLGTVNQLLTGGSGGDFANQLRLGIVRGAYTSDGNAIIGGQF